MRRRQSTSSSLDVRTGFSLIEMLIVIVIIAILSGMLLVAVNNARVQARVVAATADIKNMEKAIRDFNLKFGVDPPSFIVLYEQGALGSSSSSAAASVAPGSGNWGTDPARDGLRRQSRATIRTIWPQFDFNYMGDSPTSPGAAGPGNPTPGNGAVDLNGNGQENDIFILNGAECLAFFLGGLQFPTDLNGDGTPETVTAKGFSQNPASPMLGYTGTREGPFLEFDPARFVDTDKDTIFEYRDSLPGQSMPIQYFSAYGGQGYRVLGLDGTLGTEDDEAIANTLRSVYMQAPGTPPTPFKENSFQLISPGFDADYGYGGYCNPETGVKPAASDPPNRAPAGVHPAPIDFEKDNITNFKGGTLN